MSCYPPCSPWCRCVGQRCLVKRLDLNSFRLRALDGRKLVAANGGGNYSPLVAERAPMQEQWQTFRWMNRPRRGRPKSGSAIQLNVHDMGWTPAGFRVRADHNVVLGSGPSHGTRTVTYEIGGPGACIFVMEDFPPGYPGYQPGNPAEFTFDILKVVNGTVDTAGSPIQNGDHVVFRINSNSGNTFFFRVTGGQDGAQVHGDGRAIGQAGTVFIIDIVEVQDSVGLRPAIVKCRSCASVTVVVTDAEGRPVSGARIVASVPGHPYHGTTGADGRVLLQDDEGRTCIPAGDVVLVVTHERRNTVSMSIAVPDRGGIEVTVPMECTEVSGHVDDDQGFDLPGVEVTLTDEHGTAIRNESGQPFITTTDARGAFVFKCVPHRRVRVMIDADPSQLQNERVIPPGGWTTVYFMVVTPCSNVVGKVVDINTGQPIAGALVRENRGRYAYTNADGCFTFVCLKPAEQHALIATASGYSFGFTYATVLKDAANTFDCQNPPANTADIHTIYLTRTVVTRLRVVLNWGLRPPDLDLHASLPNNTGGRHHVYFRASNPPAAPYVTLDNDATDGMGREEITIERLSTGLFEPTDFHVWVHNFFQLVDAASTFQPSRARIEIFQDTPMGIPLPIGTYLVANAIGDQHDNLWHVVNFTVDADGFVVQSVVQSMTTGDSGTIL